MGCMFSGCSSLVYLPDIPKWNINNVTDMNCMFYKFSLLSSLPVQNGILIINLI